MPDPHPRRRPVRDDVQPTHVRDWASPGWHWEVLPGGARRLMRNPAPGPVVDPDVIGGVRVGQFRCGGTRPRRRWYVAVSGRRTSTSIATWLR